MPLSEDEINEAERLVSLWGDPARIPRTGEPLVCEWQPSDGGQHVTGIAWSGTEFTASWAAPIHEVVGKGFGAERSGAWRYQAPAYLALFRQFFHLASTPTLFNAVVVLPDRVPLEYRARQEKVPLVEKIPTRPVPPIVLSGEELRLTGICTRLMLPTENIVWTPRPRGLDLEIVQGEYQRTFDGEHLKGKKLFQSDLYADAPLLAQGLFPAIDEAWRKQGETGRLQMPLIHLWRLDIYGRVDIIAIETDGPEARLVSIRWCRESLRTMMVPHPFQAMALKQAFATRRVLCR